MKMRLVFTFFILSFIHSCKNVSSDVSKSWCDNELKPLASLDSITTKVIRRYGAANREYVAYVDAVFPQVTNVTFQIFFLSANIDSDTIKSQRYFKNSGKSILIFSGLNYVFQSAERLDELSSRADSIHYVNFQIDEGKIVEQQGNTPFSPQLDIQH